MALFRRLARGRSDTTPAWALGTVGAIVGAAVLLLILLLFALQQLV